MQINESAPAVARGQIEIAADREIVWQVLADIERWPDWNPDLNDVTLDGELAEGTVFRWKAGPGTITSTIRQLDPPRAIGWTGRTFGIRAIHVWRLESSSGGTLVQTEESWDGLPARLLKSRMQKMLQDAIDGGLQHLKAEAERRAGGTQGAERG